MFILYKVMLLLALTLQPSHVSHGRNLRRPCVSVKSESLPQPATAIKFISLRGAAKMQYASDIA